MKHYLITISCVLVALSFIMSSTSCEKNKEKDEDSIVCGGDSCLVQECKNHPSSSWKWEHCYDFSLKSTTLFSSSKYYYRYTLSHKETAEDVFKFAYGNYRETIIHEYDIWNRKK